MKKYILLFLLTLSMISYSQRSYNFEVLEGNIKDLKGVKNFSISFDQKNISIEHQESEEEFLTMQTNKHPKFRENWVTAKKETFEPRFIESFNKWYKRKGESIIENSEYHIHIKIDWIFTGFNVVAINQYAKITATYTVTKKDNPNKILFKGKCERAKGGASYDIIERVSTSYFYLAKKIATYIKRKS